MIKMNKYKLRMKTLSGLGNEYVYVYATSDFERYLNIHNLKYARDITKDYQLTDRFEKLQNNWNELKKWLEEEKDRLLRECSQIYEDSLGKTRLVSEDIYNEVKNISDKMQELEGNNE